MNSAKNYLKAFVHEEEGAEIMEYAIVLTIVVGLIAALIAIRSSVNNGLDKTKEKTTKAFEDIK